MDTIPSERLTLGFMLHDASRLMRRRFVQRARDAGLPLNRSEAMVLGEIARTEGVNQATLAARLDMEPISLVRLLDRLEAMGLAERRPQPRDRRSRTLWLTEAGQPMVERIQAIRREVRAEALSGLSPDAAARLNEALLRVRASLAEVCEATEP